MSSTPWVSRRERAQELFVAVISVGDVAGVQTRPLADAGFEIFECQRLGLHFGFDWLGHDLSP